MVTKNDVLIIDKGRIPVGKVVGTFTFLRDMGITLGEDKAIQITVSDAIEAKKIQNRWRAYFKKEACTRKEAIGNIITVYLWLEK